MKTGRRTAATRTQMVRAIRRLERVRTGSAMLTRKRKALVSELFRTAPPAVAARSAIERAAEQAYAALLHAQALQGHAALLPLGWPAREVDVEIRLARLWGVSAAEIAGYAPLQRSPAERGVPPGAVGPAATRSAERFERLTELLLDAASRELLVRRVASALSSTSRRVNLLERHVAPEIAAEIARVRATLDEREREDRTRLKQIVARRHSAEPARG